LIARRNGEVTGLLPLVEVRSRLFGRALSSLPYVNYGGVLAIDEQSTAALVRHAALLARQSALSLVLLRHRRRLLPGLPARTHKVAMTMALPGSRDATWQQLDRKVRNQVRKAEKSGLVYASGGHELLDEFYDVFSRNMRDLGTPVYGRRLFEAILSAFPQSARLHVVRLKNGTVAAALSYGYRDWLEVPSASSLREHRPLCANYLLYWSIISDAVTAGVRVFDFGRSTPGDGTYHFKQQWGAKPEPLFWEYDPLKGASVPSGDRHSTRYTLLIEAWKRLPVGVTTMLGPRLARLVP